MISDRRIVVSPALSTYSVPFPANLACEKSGENTSGSGHTLQVDLISAILASMALL